MTHNTRLFFLAIILFALAALACSLSLPAQTTSTPPTATVAVATTMVAATSTVQPSVTFTAPPPSQTSTGTPTPYPTITPIPTETVTSTITPLGANRATPTQSYACSLTDKFPDQWAIYKAHTPFQARWKLKNIGTESWEPGYIALEYISGVDMHGDEDKREIAVETLPNAEFIAIVHLVSPKRPGDYAATWGLVEKRTGNVFCAFTVKIVVE